MTFPIVLNERTGLYTHDKHKKYDEHSKRGISNPKLRFRLRLLLLLAHTLKIKVYYVKALIKL